MSTERRCFAFREEPSGKAYDELLDLGLAVARHGSLVRRRGVRSSPEAEALWAKLRPFAVSETEESEWPGTRLLGDTATVLRFSITTESAALLRGTANSLYAWCQPGLPEDLAFLRADGSAVLGTIAHEEDAFLCLLRTELELVERALPDLKNILEEESGAESGTTVPLPS